MKNYIKNAIIDYVTPLTATICQQTGINIATHNNRTEQNSHLTRTLEPDIMTYTAWPFSFHILILLINQI